LNNYQFDNKKTNIVVLNSKQRKNVDATT